MNKNPMVSVCVVTYQHVNYIKQCLDGILMQKAAFPFEIILGEDESTDGTREICMEYANKYPNIIRLFLRQRKDVIYINKKPTGRYNFVESLKACKGKYVALCEGDDYWTDSLKLQKQVDFLEKNPNYIISGHNAISIDEKNNILDDSYLGINRKQDCSGLELMCGRHILTLSMCFRNILNFFPEQFYKSLNGDTFLVALLGQYGDYKFQSEIDNGVYRIHKGGMWSNEQEQFQLKSKINTYLNMFKYFRKKSIPKVYDELFNKYFNASRNLIGFNFNSKKHEFALRIFFTVILNCFYYGYYRKLFQLINFILIIKNINLWKAR